MLVAKGLISFRDVILYLKIILKCEFCVQDNHDADLPSFDVQVFLMLLFPLATQDGSNHEEFRGTEAIGPVLVDGANDGHWCGVGRIVEVVDARRSGGRQEKLGGFLELALVRPLVA